MWGAVSDERPSLWFSDVAGPWQRRYYFLSECCCLKFAVLFLRAALSDERTGLQFSVQSLKDQSLTVLVTIYITVSSESPPTWRARFLQEQDGPVQSQSHATTDGQSISMSWRLVHAALEGLHLNEFQSDIRRGALRQKLFMLPLGRLRVKHAEQHRIWVPTQHLLWDKGKPRKTLIELAGHRTFQMQTDF
jgi:hypothetical protein